EAYIVRVDGATEQAARGGARVFTSEAGKEFAIEVMNDSSADVGVSIVIDGLDARTGTPVSSCEYLAGWSIPASGELVARGFEMGAHRIAAYRFAPREGALTTLVKDGHPESVGSIEVCFFSLKPREPHEPRDDATSSPPASPSIVTEENRGAPA